DGDALPRQTSYKIERNAGGPGNWFVFMPNELWQRIEKFLLGEEHFMVNRVEVLCHLASIRKFAVVLLGVPDRKSFNRFSPNFGQQGGNRAGIDSAAEKNAQRHVAHQMTADRLLQYLAVFRNIIGLRSFKLGAR